ncbi:Rieske 2Fe-2S domain-containing protein (plasmid) [Diaphorobacter sp. HDW4B]|uniref:Rieske (2Fe-2S) protein n=1 Tax=Diaphorobacter sp. HDW4B TaxID=2714925 RepID=UPI0014096F4C|nr:Rieske 2Fe-2S domain-containing protein [Diaphorobacter sp. HDW4B]QIL74010.1 Rieske 2Fe-2S domain-containing protein [Diaphorobacter sp. HDW4B]
MAEAPYQDVADLSSLPPGAQLRVTLGATALLLCHEAATGQVWALKNSCPHAFQPFDGGVVSSGTIQCPKHGACFDLASGRATNRITARPITVYAVHIEGDRILVSTQPTVPTEELTQTRSS